MRWADEQMRDTARTCVVDVTKRLIRIIKRSLAARDRAFGKFNKSFLAACAVVPVDTAAPLSPGFICEIPREREKEKEREREGQKDKARLRIPNTWLLIILFYFHSHRFVLFCLRGLSSSLFPGRRAAASNERRPKRE